MSKLKLIGIWLIIVTISTIVAIVFFKSLDFYIPKMIAAFFGSPEYIQIYISLILMFSLTAFLFWIKKTI